MFFKQNVLERLLKRAYQTSGLIVGHYAFDSESGGYTGNYWKIWIRDNRMPKEVKAAIIKLCGDLPAMGEVFMAMKDRANQYELEEVFENLPEEFSKCTIELRSTNLLQTGKNGLLRYLQNEFGNPVTIRQEVDALIDYNAIDRDGGEWEPDGPLMNENRTHSVWWGNEECILKADIVFGEPEEKAFRMALSKTKII